MLDSSSAPRATGPSLSLAHTRGRGCAAVGPTSHEASAGEAPDRGHPHPAEIPPVTPQQASKDARSKQRRQEATNGGAHHQVLAPGACRTSTMEVSHPARFRVSGNSGSRRCNSCVSLIKLRSPHQPLGEFPETRQAGQGMAESRRHTKAMNELQAELLAAFQFTPRLAARGFMIRLVLVVAGARQRSSVWPASRATGGGGNFHELWATHGDHGLLARDSAERRAAAASFQRLLRSAG